jgi:hypothetical protein
MESRNLLTLPGRVKVMAFLLFAASRSSSVAARTAVALTPCLLKTQLRSYRAQYPGNHAGNLGRALRQVVFRERRLQLERIAGRVVRFEEIPDPD